MPKMPSTWAMVIVFAAADAEPGHEMRDGDVGLSAQERTKSTSASHVSWGTQQPVRVPQDFFFDEVPFEDGDFLVIGEMATWLVHGGTSVQVMLTRTERFSGFD